MVTRAGGLRRKSRNKFRKKIRSKGKVSIVAFFQKFGPGDQVVLKAEPSFHKGLYHVKFHSKVGRVLKSRGDCFEVEIKDGNKPKTLIIHPVHLRRCQKQK